jgi:hypothetical protein
MFPSPLDSTAYGLDILSRQISIDLLIWAHVPTTIIGIIFAWFVWRQTKKLSALYLLYTSVAFGIFSYLALVTWSGNSVGVMYTWSLLDIFSLLTGVLCYWFLYAFIRGKDVPAIHALFTSLLILPALVYTTLGLNLHTLYQPEIIAIDEDIALIYMPTAQAIIILCLLYITATGYIRAKSPQEKSRSLLSGAGVTLFLAIFSFIYLISNMMLYFEIGTPTDAYNISVYAHFSMPFLIAFLGYLIAKYQAFDLKLTRSIGFIVILMGLLFVSIFI